MRRALLAALTLVLILGALGCGRVGSPVRSRPAPPPTAAEPAPQPDDSDSEEKKK